MADVIRKEPVLIENVNLIINVYNIGHNDLGRPPAHSPGNGYPEFLPSGIGGVSELPSNTTTTATTNSTATSYGLQEQGDRSDISLEKQYPLGWIANSNGDTIPFGILSIAAEIPSFGDTKTWKEIRVCLPPSLLADNETDLCCPVPSCREKLPRNKSMDSHIKKHLGLLNKAPGLPIHTKNYGGLPCPLVYYCQDKKCQYYVESAEKSFKAYKNVKQHYQKVHAPKLYECDLCQKTFSTLKVAETHKLMCGEKYACSTCHASYNSLEALQTHCRRKVHVYDHIKYKDKRNSLKQEIQSLKNPTLTTIPNGSTCGRKPKASGSRKFPILLPKLSASSNTEVFSSIQALCQQAGVKVDYGCQTVCTAILHKSDPIEAVLAPTTPPVTQKKRKSTDTQTNIVKFRATCLDQKHNATNTNQDWKKVITSDSQTQTPDSCENNEGIVVDMTGIDTSALVNDEFATIKISEKIDSSKKADVPIAGSTQTMAAGAATTTTNLSSSTGNDSKKPGEIKDESQSGSETSISTSDKAAATSQNLKQPTASESNLTVDNGPSLYQEFITFLEGIDSATQTDPDIFKSLGGHLLGINVNLEEFSGTEKNAYVSVSSTASQTAVENVPTMSLSAEDYEALLSTPEDVSVVNDLMKTEDGSLANPEYEDERNPGLLLDWENIVEEVYRDLDNQNKNLQLSIN